jgi:hypothetical protein
MADGRARSLTWHVSRGVASILVFAFVLTALPAAAAGAEPVSRRIPAGWAIEGNDLVWVSETSLHMGGARYEFRSGERLLGYPAQEGDTLRLPLTSSGPLADLSVWAAGRQLDARAPSLRGPSVAASTEEKIAHAAVDPAQRGPYRTRRLHYELPGLAIDGYASPIEVIAEVIAPVGAHGALPLVLFLHGRHSTCYRGGPAGEASGDWPCPAGWKPVPSYIGYRYIADVLASQGYLTVSISANGINGQDFVTDGGASARSQLVRHHLSLWARWNTHGGDPWGGLFRDRVDMTNVVLVGHSRGGEGVERATIDSDERDPWKIQGLVLIGPTAFGRQVAPGVHTTVILPFCDGDVSDLQGQQYVDIGRDLTDDRGLRTSVLAMGTNHNFYNTEWTPGLSRSPAWDDWYAPNDVHCGQNRSQRLTPTEQQAVGLAYTTALVHLAIDNDPTMLPLLDGTRVEPRSIGRATTHVHAIGGDKRIVYAPGRGIKVTARSLKASECRGYFLAGPFDLRPGCTPSLSFDLLPHWLPMSFAETLPAPRALKVTWHRLGGAVRIPVTRNLSGVDALDFRIAGRPGALPVDLVIRVRDATGAAADLALRPVSLRPFNGRSPLGKVEAQEFRASLRGVALDLSRITAIKIIPRTHRGLFWLFDVSTWRSHLPSSDQIHLPRVSVGDLVVAEGDSGEVTLRVPVSIDGVVARRADLWVQLTDYASFDQPMTGSPLVLERGATSATVPVTYQADNLYNPYLQLLQITLVARTGAVTGKYDGSVTIQEDDPAPTLTVDANEVTATEGSSLEWTFRLSEPMANDVFWSIQVVAPRGRASELDTNDVPPSFLEQYGIVPPDPAVPLSELGIWFGIEFAPGATEATVSIPIADDGASEREEEVALVLEGFDDPVVPLPIELTGSVPAN